MNTIKGYDFDDVLLMPENTTIHSRSQVSVTRTPYGTLPIFSSTMKYISEPKFVVAFSNAGGIGLLHRFDAKETRINNIDLISKECIGVWGVGIGIRNEAEELEICKYALDKGAKFICIDVANGYNAGLLEFIDRNHDILTSKSHYLMAGNVATFYGAYELSERGVDFIRVGIGPGSTCITRNITGVGVPQLTAIDWCRDIKNDITKTRYVVADGGIRNSGDIVKSLASGADFVMLGRLLANAEECGNDGNIIYGMASEHIATQYSSPGSIEGINVVIPASKLPVKQILDSLISGIQSACTYLDCYSVEELSNMEHIFVQVGANSLKKISS